MKLISFMNTDLEISLKLVSFINKDYCIPLYSLSPPVCLEYQEQLNMAGMHADLDRHRWPVVITLVGDNCEYWEANVATTSTLAIVRLFWHGTTPSLSAQTIG